MSNKLTEAQQFVLNEMRAGAKAYYMPYAGNNTLQYWFLSGKNNRKCTRQIMALIGLGLVKIIEWDIYDHPSIAVACKEIQINESEREDDHE